MELDEVDLRVKKVISQVLKIGVGEITSTANISYDLGADSMQSLELVAGFEEEFNISMDEDAALGVQDVAGAVTFISDIINQNT